MSKVLCFIYEKMADFEMTFACHLLSYYGEKEVITIAYDMNAVKGSSGIDYHPNNTVKEALDFEDIEALIIPGGWDMIFQSEIFELIQKLDKEKKLICAICAGPRYLALAGILEGRNYTTTLNPEYFDESGEEDPFPRQTFINNDVVRDEHIITAKGNAFIDFGIEIVDYYNLFENDEQKEQYARHFKTCS